MGKLAKYVNTVEGAHETGLSEPNDSERPIAKGSHDAGRTYASTPKYTPITPTSIVPRMRMVGETFLPSSQ